MKSVLDVGIDEMARYKGKHFWDVYLTFDRDIETDEELAVLKEGKGRLYFGDIVWLERRQAIHVAKAILRRFAPEVLK